MRSAFRKFIAASLLLVASLAAQAQFTPFTAVDIGGPDVVGSTVSNGLASYTVSGGGNEMWGDSDQGHFAYYTQTGDFDLRVRVESLTANSRWSKAGIMLREDLSGTSEDIFTYVAPPNVPTPNGGNGVNNHNTGWRTGNSADGGATGGQHEISTGTPNYPNAWVRMTRSGNVVNTLYSANGATWTAIAAFDMANTGTPSTAFLHPIPTTALVGFAISSHNNGGDPAPHLATAEFRDFGGPSNAVFITGSPTSRTAVVGLTSTFSFNHAGGFDFLSIQWRKNGVNIGGANSATYTTPALTLGDSGSTFDVVVSNPFDSSSATSGVATLTVISAPQLVAASTRNDPNGIYLTFDHQMDGTTVLNPANYTVNNGVTVSGVTLWGPGSNGVRVAVSALAPNTTYTVSVANVQDSAASTIFPSPSTANVSHTVNSGRLTLRRYDGSGDFTEVKNKIANCVTPDRFNPNLPTFEYGTNPQINTTDGDTEQYGAIVNGFFVPATTGNHIFGFAADDNAELWLSTDSNPAHKVLIAQQTSWNGARQFISGDNNIVPLTAGIPLVAGQRYYMEGLYQEGGGGDHMSVAVQTPGGPAIINGTQNVMPSSFFAQVISYGCPAVYVDNLGPVALTGPGNQSVVQNSTATFTTVVDGSPPFTAQWYSNGVAIAGATGFTYSFPVQLAANGKVFSVVVNNLFSSATNSSTLTVIPAPQMLNAGSRVDPSGTNIYVQFSKDMGAAALVPGSYTVDGGVTVSAAAFHNGDLQLVRLTVSSLTPGAVYNVTGTGITDPDGNVLAPNPTTRTFTHLAGINPPSGLSIKRFDGSGDINNLINKINTCVTPQRYTNTIINMEYQTSEGGGEANGNTFNDGNTENYGVWIYGLFVPPTTGNYVFGLANDDVARLYISTDSSPANKVLIIDKPAWGGFRDFVLPANGNTVAPLSAPIPMVAGRKYYMEALNGEGGGGDTLSVAVQVPGGPAIVDGTQNVIPRTMFATNASFGCPPSAFFNNLGPVAIVDAPVSTTVNELSPATFSVGLDGSPAYTYQWYSNNVPVPGATAAKLTFTPLRFANGAQYQVIAANGFSAVTSAPVTLNVISDTIGAGIVRAFGSGVFTNVTVAFNEPLELTSAATAANYAITNSAGAPLTVFSAFVRDNTNVVLRTAAQTPGERYTVIVNNVLDRAGVPNPVPANSTKTFTAWVYTPGYALMEVYGPAGSTTIQALTNMPSYPNYPRERYYITTTSSRVVYPDDSHDNYGGRISGLFAPTSTGNFTFRISRDDDARLNGSLTENPANAQTIINVVCCDDTYAAASPPLPLTAGSRYYYELLWKEGGGGDYGKLSVDGVNSIPASLLGVYANPDDANLQVTLVPVNTTKLEGETATFNVAATASPGYVITYQWYTNGIPIPGATANNYTTPVLNLNNNGLVFSVVSIVPGALATNSATLTVNPDVTAPVLLSARVAETGNQIVLTYSEAINPAIGDNSSFYLFDGVTLAEPGVTLREINGSIVTLTLAYALPLNTAFTLYGEGQQDLYGNVTDPFTTETPLFAYQPYGLTHRYSFRNFAGPASGSNVIDSVGGAHGVVLGVGANFTGDKLVLAGGSSATAAYVDLPNGLLSTNGTSFGGNGEVTIEGWTKVTGNQSWARIFDFGSTSGAEITGPGGSGNGRRYLMLSAQVGGDVNTHRLEATSDDGSYPNAFTQDFPANFNQVEHFVITWDDNNNRIQTFVNGVLRQDFATAASLNDILDVNVWLGRSTWTGDNNIQGEFDEFRIYNRILSAGEITLNEVAGPNNAMGAPLAVRVVPTSATMAQGSSQQARVFADFTGAANVDITATRTFTLISDNPALVSVSPSSLLTAAPSTTGTAHLTASFGGVSSTPVTVTVNWPATLTIVPVNALTNRVSWTGLGTLQSAPEVDGPWTDTPSQANPQDFDILDPRKFFRTR